MITWTAWINYKGQHGGMTTVEADDAVAALSAAMTWAAKGSYEPGDSYDVNVMPEADFERTNRFEPKIGTTVRVA